MLQSGAMKMIVTGNKLQWILCGITLLCNQISAGSGHGVHLGVPHSNPGSSVSANISVPKTLIEYRRANVNQDNLSLGGNLCKSSWRGWRDLSKASLYSNTSLKTAVPILCGWVGVSWGKLRMAEVEHRTRMVNWFKEYRIKISFYILNFVASHWIHCLFHRGQTKILDSSFSWKDCYLPHRASFLALLVNIYSISTS